MSKYKTILSTDHQASLEEAIEQRLITNRLTRSTFSHEGCNQTLATSNKSIIFIKLPRKPQYYLNSFRSSLYKSSLKRLKQQKVSTPKDPHIPYILPKKPFQYIEQQVMCKPLKEPYSKKHTLPILHRLIRQEEKKYSSVLQQLSEKSSEEEEENVNWQPSIVQTQVLDKKSIFEVDSAALGFKNLKQKYLELRQLSLTNKKKSQLLEKPQYRRSSIDQQPIQEDSKFKMDKAILEHMNRYKRKDLFQTKVSGFKTTLYPVQKSTLKQQQHLQERKRQLNSVRDEQQMQNVIKRKKIRSCAHNTISECPRASLQSNERQNVKQRVNPQILSNWQECTPWETDLVNFD